MSRPRRDRTDVSREIAEVERHLVDMPPHSGSGYREDLRARLDRLRRELADIDAARASASDEPR